MNAVGVIATLQILQGKEAEFEQILKEMTNAVHRDEPGCEFYAGFRSKDGVRTYKVLERYHDQAAFDAHMKTAHFHTAGAKLTACLAGPPNMEILASV